MSTLQSSMGDINTSSIPTMWPFLFYFRYNDHGRTIRYPDTELPISLTGLSKSQTCCIKVGRSCLILARTLSQLCQSAQFSISVYLNISELSMFQ